MRDTSPARERLIIGVDYGTTYSGISYAKSTVKDPSEIVPWTKYPGGETHQSGSQSKAPSWIAVPDDEENDDLDRVCWGYEIDGSMKAHAWTKLLLDTTSRQTKYDDGMLSEMIGDGLGTLPPGYEPSLLVQKYLEGMYNMMWEEFTVVFGERRLSKMPMDVVVTVPAVWSEKARGLTERAALKAGFASRPEDTLKLIAEPEAAAHIAVKSKLLEASELVVQGTGLMVCDAGGGTIDLTTYVVRQTKPLLLLDEIVVGAGGKCGGSFIDRNLHKLLEERFGEIYTSVSKLDTGPGSPFMDSFEGQKQIFRNTKPGKKSIKLRLELPALTKNKTLASMYAQYYDSKAKRIILSHEDMKSLFDPVIEKVLQLVSDQITAAAATQKIQTIVLVGGFGQSPYLRERIKDYCNNHQIWLTTPETGAWSAVMRGAVLHGLEQGIIKQRLSRKHYGITLDPYYDESVHDMVYKDGTHVRIYDDSVTGMKMISGHMSWSLAKGVTITEESLVDIRFVLTLNLKEDKARKHHMSLKACENDTAPEWFDPELIEIVGNVEYSLEGTDWASCLKIKSDGTAYYEPALVCQLRPADSIGYMTIRILDDSSRTEVGKAKLSLE